MTDTSLYDADILAWSEQQAELLRRLGRTRRDLPNDLDLENIVEEIETVGRNELRAAESYVRFILTHLIKSVSDPSARALGHWRAEALTQHNDLLGAISPSMRPRIDMDVLWRRALREAEAALEAQGCGLAPGLAGSCPIALDDLLAEDFDLRAAAARLSASLAEARSA